MNWASRSRCVNADGRALDGGDERLIAGTSPSVHAPGEATPSAPVETIGNATCPPPVAANVTGIPCLGFPSESTSRTAGATGTFERMVALCWFPATTSSAL